VLYLRKGNSVGISGDIRNTKKKEDYAMMTTQTYALPQDIEETINELVKLKKKIENREHTVSDIFAYTDQMSMLLTDLKIATINGQISKDTFETLKWEYIRVVEEV